MKWRSETKNVVALSLWTATGGTSQRHLAIVSVHFWDNLVEICRRCHCFSLVSTRKDKPTKTNDGQSVRIGSPDRTLGPVRSGSVRFGSRGREQSVAHILPTSQLGQVESGSVGFGWQTVVVLDRPHIKRGLFLRTGFGWGSTGFGWRRFLDSSGLGWVRPGSLEAILEFVRVRLGSVGFGCEQKTIPYSLIIFHVRVRLSSVGFRWGEMCRLFRLLTRSRVFQTKPKKNRYTKERKRLFFFSRRTQNQQQQQKTSQRKEKQQTNKQTKHGLRSRCTGARWHFGPVNLQTKTTHCCSRCVPNLLFWFNQLHCSFIQAK